MNTGWLFRVRLRYESRPASFPCICFFCTVADTAEITPEAERELVARACTGSEDAFATLMRNHYDPVFRLVNSILRDEHSARDVCRDG